MKILKRVLLLIILIITFIISIKFKNDKIYYISLGDGISKGINNNGYEGYSYSDYISKYLENNNKLKFYTKDFSNQDDRIIDLINKINENIELQIDNKNITIQNAIVNSDIITLSIGYNEIIYKYKNNENLSYMYEYIDSYIKDLNNLLKLVRSYNNKEIYVLGYYGNNTNLDKYIKYLNTELIKICNKNEVKYIDLYNVFKNNTKLISNNLYPNTDGYKLIANEIIKNIKKDVNK